MSDADLFRGLFLAWQNAVAAYNRDGGAGGSEAERTLYRRMTTLEDFAASHPARTLEAFAFKLLIADDRGDINGTAAQRALVAETQAITDQVEWQDAPDSIPSLYRQYRATMAAIAVFPVAEGLDIDAELDALFFGVTDELERLIEAQPAVTAADFAAKAVIATARGTVFPDWPEAPLWQEALALLAA